MRRSINEEAATGVQPDDGETGTPTGGTIVNNVTTTLTEASDFEAAPRTEAENITRADQHATDVITLQNWTPTHFVDKNPSGIWHIALREEPGHPIEAMRAVLIARSESYWTDEFTTRGHSWGHDPEALNPDEFRFTYIDRYELADTLVSTRTGEWTCTFRRVPEGD